MKKIYIYIGIFFITLNFLTAQEQSDTLKAAEYLKQSKDLWVNQQRYEESLSLVEKAGNIYRSVEAWGKYVETLGIAGRRMVLSAQINRAEATLQKALDISIQKLGNDHPATAETYAQLGGLYFEKKDFLHAIENFNLALEIQKKIYGEKAVQVGLTFNNLSTVFGKSGDTDKQLFYLESALNIFNGILMTDPTRTDAIDYSTTCYTNLSTVYKAKKDFNKQLEFLQKALSLCLKYKGEFHERTAFCYSNLSTYYKELKNYDKELTFIQKTISVREKLFGKNNINLSKNYIQSGWCFFNKNDYPKAEENFKQALSLRIELLGTNNFDVANAWFELGSFYKKIGKLTEALDATQRSLAAYDPNYNFHQTELNPSFLGIPINQDITEALNQKAMLLQMLPSADKNNDIALNTYNRIFDLLDSLHRRYSVAANFEAKNKVIEKFLPAYESGLNTAYNLYATKGDRNYFDEAMSILERGKSFVFLESIRETEAKNLGGVTDTLLFLEKSIKTDMVITERSLSEAKISKDDNKIQALESKLSSLRVKYSGLMDNLQKNYKKYYDLKYSNSVATISEICNTFDKNTLFIDYFLGDSALYMLAICGGEVYFLKENDIHSLSDNLTKYRRCLSDFKYVTENSTAAYNDFLSSSSFLYDNLIKDFLNKFDEKVKKIVISPDGYLNFIPFETLLTQAVENSGGIRYQDLPYLLVKYPVSYYQCASLAVINKKEAKKAINKKCLAFAPNYAPSQGDNQRNQKLEDLPGAVEEVNSIGNYFQGLTFKNETATKDAFLQNYQNYGILHFALHADANDSYPMFSNMNFVSAGTDANTKFFAYEIYNLKPAADLAVLSACETGYGKYIRGEGVTSIARAFITSGIPSVVTTLWKVSDKSSSTLISTFYKYLAQGMDKDEALRQAKLEYLRNANNLNSHPFFWAGFTLQGETTPFRTSSNSRLYLIIGVALAFLIVVFIFYKYKKS